MRTLVAVSLCFLFINAWASHTYSQCKGAFEHSKFPQEVCEKIREHKQSNRKDFIGIGFVNQLHLIQTDEKNDFNKNLEEYLTSLGSGDNLTALKDSMNVGYNKLFIEQLKNIKTEFLLHMKQSNPALVTEKVENHEETPKSIEHSPITEVANNLQALEIDDPQLSFTVQPNAVTSYELLVNPLQLFAVLAFDECKGVEMWCTKNNINHAQNATSQSHPDEGIPLLEEGELPLGFEMFSETANEGAHLHYGYKKYLKEIIRERALTDQILVLLDQVFPERVLIKSFECSFPESKGEVVLFCPYLQSGVKRREEKKQRVKKKTPALEVKQCITNAK